MSLARPISRSTTLLHQLLLLLRHSGHPDSLLPTATTAASAIFCRSLCTSATPTGDLNPLLDSWEPNDEDEDRIEAIAKKVGEMRAKAESTAWRFPKHVPKRAELLEALYGHPFIVRGSKCPVDIKEDDDGVYARVDMPGIHVKGVKLWFSKEDSNLHFEGAEDRDLEYGHSEVLRKYSNCIYLPRSGGYQTDKIKAGIKDGVLRILVPKVKPRVDG